MKYFRRRGSCFLYIIFTVNHTQAYTYDLLPPSIQKWGSSRWDLFFCFFFALKEGGGEKWLVAVAWAGSITHRDWRSSHALIAITDDVWTCLPVNRRENGVQHTQFYINVETKTKTVLPFSGFFFLLFQLYTTFTHKRHTQAFFVCFSFLNYYNFFFLLFGRRSDEVVRIIFFFCCVFRKTKIWHPHFRLVLEEPFKKEFANFEGRVHCVIIPPDVKVLFLFCF